MKSTTTKTTSVNTKNYKKITMKDGSIDDLCRRCNSAVENIQHIISRCQTLIQLDYKARPNCVAEILHEKLALKYSLLNESTSYYKCSLSKALENNLACLYWDRSILTNETAPHNHPDITLFEKTI